MTYIEFFGQDVLENLCTCLAMAPDKVILVGDNRKTLAAHAARYERLLRARREVVEFDFVAVDRNNISSILEALERIIQQEPDCMFDLTGGGDLFLVAIGILSERYREEILQEIPEVDAILGTSSFMEIADVLDRILSGESHLASFGPLDSLPEETERRILSTGGVYAFLKIAEQPEERSGMEMDERLKKQLQFALEIDKEKNILRQNHISGGGPRENDAEHAWHMAVMAYLLREYSNEDVDIARVMLMCLIHDVVEIDAGDTYAYDEVAKQDQAERELAAADRIFGLLPQDAGAKLREIWEEFEAWETPEAKFARALDNFQPLMLNNATDGISWVEHGVKLSQVIKRNGRSKLGSEELWEYAYNNFICPNVEKGRIIDDVADEDKPHF